MTEIGRVYMNKLNKNSSVPLYQQLVDEIKSQIDSGILKENDRIMTETELSDAYEVRCARPYLFLWMKIIW